MTFHYVKNSLFVEGAPVKKIAAKVGTPLYIYSQSRVLDNFRSFDRAFSAFPHLICYALKANSNLSLARTLSREGAGADIVSSGELYRALRAGFSPEKMVFSGVGKTVEEMKAGLLKNILMFNVESLEELSTLNRTARSLNKKAPVSVRVNPDVQADTHSHITTGTSDNKFGIHKKAVLEAYKTARSMKNISILGIQAHIGSQITSIAPFLSLLKNLLGFVKILSGQGIHLKYLDIGGGLGIQYKDETPPPPSALAKVFAPYLKGSDLTLLFEPGRFLVGDSGILVTKVLYRKNTGKKIFVIVDAAMNDLARPALYDAYHEIVPVERKGNEVRKVDVVGPVCESGDFFARSRKIEFPESGDFLAIKNTGAYGFSMSSQYNSRPRAAEVLVRRPKLWKIIRKRETFKDLVRGEE